MFAKLMTKAWRGNCLKIPHQNCSFQLAIKWRRLTGRALSIAYTGPLRSMAILRSKGTSIQRRSKLINIDTWIDASVIQNNLHEYTSLANSMIKTISSSTSNSDPYHSPHTESLFNFLKRSIIADASSGLKVIPAWVKSRWISLISSMSSRLVNICIIARGAFPVSLIFDSIVESLPILAAKSGFSRNASLIFSNFSVGKE